MTITPETFAALLDVLLGAVAAGLIWLWRNIMSHKIQLTSLRGEMESKVALSTQKFDEVERRLDAGQAKMNEIRNDVSGAREDLAEIKGSLAAHRQAREDG